MKKPEEYLDDYGIYNNSTHPNLEIREEYELKVAVIKNAQKDAYNQALEDATNIVDWNYCEYSWEIPEGCPSTGDSEYGYYYINKESILKLKK